MPPKFGSCAVAWSPWRLQAAKAAATQAPMMPSGAGSSSAPSHYSLRGHSRAGWVRPRMACSLPGVPGARCRCSPLLSSRVRAAWGRGRDENAPAEQAEQEYRGDRQQTGTTARRWGRQMVAASWCACHLRSLWWPQRRLLHSYRPGSRGYSTRPFTWRCTGGRGMAGAAEVSGGQTYKAHILVIAHKEHLAAAAAMADLVGP